MPSPCIVLVPVAGSIDPRCEQALHGLERRGYTVRRVLGFSAIDFGRCVLASEALAEGYEELMWVDSDVGFHPDDVEKLRGHNLPFVCGIYAKKSRPEFACDFLPGTRKVDFGQIGGLHEIRYAGFGFVHTRRELYETMRQRLELPECNQRFGKPVVPYFMPLLVPDGARKDAASLARAAGSEAATLARGGLRGAAVDVVFVGGLRLLRTRPPVRVQDHGRHHHSPLARRQLRLLVGRHRPQARQARQSQRQHAVGQGGQRQAASVRRRDRFTGAARRDRPDRVTEIRHRWTQMNADEKGKS